MCGLKHALDESEILVHQVTPFVGVWIETVISTIYPIAITVTPFVGVWIETRQRRRVSMAARSHPSWVCGLKHGKNAI